MATHSPNRIRRKANRLLYKLGKTVYARMGYVKMMGRNQSSQINVHQYTASTLGLSGIHFKA